jgi:hypothetical protein
MHEGLEDAVDGGFGDVRALVDGLQRHGPLALLKDFQNIESLGKNRNEVQALRGGFGQGAASGKCHGSYITGVSIPKRGA